MLHKSNTKIKSYEPQHKSNTAVKTYVSHALVHVRASVAHFANKGATPRFMHLWCARLVADQALPSVGRSAPPRCFAFFSLQRGCGPGGRAPDGCSRHVWAAEGLSDAPPSTTSAQGRLPLLSTSGRAWPPMTSSSLSPTTTKALVCCSWGRCLAPRDAVCG